MKFSEALQAAIDTGIGIYRTSWPGCGERSKGIPQFVEPRRHVPLNREGPLELGPFLCVQTHALDIAPWSPTHADLFAEDWATL